MEEYSKVTVSWMDGTYSIFKPKTVEYKSGGYELDCENTIVQIPMANVQFIEIEK